MTDAETLDIKKRARRRLVGAVALALCAAVVLPLMMEQEPHPGSADIQLSIPPRPGLSVPADAVSTDAVSTELPIELPAPATAELPPLVAESAQPEAPQSAAVPKPQAPEPSSTPARSAPASAGKPAGEKPQSTEAARALAALEGRNDAASRKPAPRANSFVLQIGAFADAAKASSLAAELKGRGFPAYTEPAGKVTRVRIGPLQGRAAADKTAAELALLGYSTVSSPL